jgi:hypothetical protein
MLKEVERLQPLNLGIVDLVFASGSRMTKADTSVKSGRMIISSCSASKSTLLANDGSYLRRHPEFLQ